MPFSKIHLYNWVSFIAALITIAGAFGFLSSDTTNARWWVFAVFFMVLFVVLCGLLVWQILSSGRYARYTEALQPLHRFYHALRDAFYLQRGGNSEVAIKHHVQEALRSLSVAFSLISGTRCRVCIKILYIPEERPTEVLPGRTREFLRLWAVKTYCRSDDTDEHPNSRQNDPDWVSDNSDFENLLVQPDKKSTSRCYFQNALPYLGYKNSHYTESEMKNGEMAYRSTIVWPIRKKIPLTPDAESDILGFLCVDSAAKNAFRKSHDVEIGSACADALYMFLHLILR